MFPIIKALLMGVVRQSCRQLHRLGCEDQLDTGWFFFFFQYSDHLHRVEDYVSFGGAQQQQQQQQKRRKEKKKT